MLWVILWKHTNVVFLQSISSDILLRLYIAEVIESIDCLRYMIFEEDINRVYLEPKIKDILQANFLDSDYGYNLITGISIIGLISMIRGIPIV